MQESPIAAAIRHLKQATGVSLEQADCSMFKKFYLRLPDKDFELYLFKISLTEDPQVLLNKEEYSKFIWASPSEAFTLPLIPGAEIYLKQIFDKKSP